MPPSPPAPALPDTPPPTAVPEAGLRSALGRFATGVTLLTAMASDGRPFGLTINSFNSVSLDPPLILWSLSLKSPKITAFREAHHYAVNVLAAGQAALSARFASADPDRFSALPFRCGHTGAPLIEGCCAWFECAHAAQYPGGDHLIFLGKIEHFCRGAASEPLVFFDGDYRALEKR